MSPDKKVLQTLAVHRNMTLCGHRACRLNQTVVKLQFTHGRVEALSQISCASDVQTCGEKKILFVCATLCGVRVCPMSKF